MLKSSNPTRRIAGRLLVVTGIAAALPLTASRAVEYVDVPASAGPAASAAPQAPAAGPGLAATTVAVLPATSPVPASQPAAPVAPNAHAFTFRVAPGRHLAFAATRVPTAALPAALPAAAATPSAPLSTYNIVSADGQHYIVRGAPPQSLEIRGDGETFVIDGKTKRWEQLTPAEKDEVRRAVAKANAALAKTHIDQARIMQEVAAIPDRAHLADLQRELARTQVSVAQSVRRMDEQAARERAAGRQPDQLEAAIRATLQSVQAIDLSVASRALAHVDRDKITADVANAQASMEAAKAELARIQARMDSEERH